MNQLVITKHDNTLYILLFDELNYLIECHPYPVGETSYVGSIYVGIVRKKVKGINAYFVDYGDEKDGYLPIDKALKPLSPGESVLIQVEKDPYQTKGAKLSGFISISGEYLVIVTDSNKIHFSSKLEEDEETKRLKKIALQYKHNDYGFIVRTNAYKVDTAVIEDEFARLISELERIKNVADFRVKKSCVYKPQYDWLKCVQNMNKSEIISVRIDDLTIATLLKEYLDANGLKDAMKIHLEKESLYRILDMTNLIRKACQRKVWLNSGASIIIDKTEAMYVIDVNSDKNISKTNSHKNTLKINLEAAKAICHHIRLRNLSGIILIDFIDMYFENDKKELLDTLIALTKEDPIKTTVHGITSLGIVEVTRKRIEAPLCQRLDFIM